MILVKNGRLIDPSSGRDEIADILIEGETIKRIGRNISGVKAERVIDAAGLIVAPGLIDVHTHLREPGYEWKETIATGTGRGCAGRFYISRLHGEHGPRE